MIKQIFDLLSNFFGQSPPPYIIWIAVGLTFLHVSVAIYAQVASSRNERKKREVSVLDEYWFRAIAHPFFVEPMFSFLTTMLTKFETLPIANQTKARQTYDQYLSEFREKKKEIRCRLGFLKATDVKAHSLIGEYLRGLEDKVTLYCAIQSGVVGQPDEQVTTKEDVTRAYEEVLVNTITTLKNSQKNLV